MRLRRPLPAVQGDTLHIVGVGDNRIGKDYSLNIAKETGASFGIELDIAQSTTGDGFYVWNRNKGQEADANLFCVLMIALAHQALQLRTISPPYIPTIRTSFGFGSHYSYHQHDSLDPFGHDYIVGDVTMSCPLITEPRNS